MAMVTITADSSNKSLQSLSFERNPTSRDPSFSSYLKGSEENFVAEDSRHLKSFPAIPDDRLQLKQKNKSGYEGEIDVFTADRYFSEAVGEMSPKIVNKDDPVDIASLKQKIRPRTPSVRSESSWNSRISLLHKQKTDQQKAKMSRTKRFLVSIGCRCSCNGEDSVHVDNQSSEGNAAGVAKGGNMNQLRSPDSNTWHNEDRLYKKIDGSKHLVADTPSSVRDQVSNPLHNQEKCERKMSLEVFGSPIQSKGDKSLNLEKHVGKKLACFATLKKAAETEEISAESNEMYNDTDSDASSDLFEIESFSTNTNIGPSLTRQASDGIPEGCVSPTTCYAPSEVSIQWSTVTESMADFSMVSDSEELDIITAATTNHSIKQTTNRRPPGILAGCKNYKAVRVAEEAYRTTDKAFIHGQKQQQRIETSKPTKIFLYQNNINSTRKDIQHRFTASSATESRFKSVPHTRYTH